MADAKHQLQLDEEIQRLKVAQSEIDTLKPNRVSVSTLSTAMFAQLSSHMLATVSQVIKRRFLSHRLVQGSRAYRQYGIDATDHVFVPDKHLYCPRQVEAGSRSTKSASMVAVGHLRHLVTAERPLRYAVASLWACEQHDLPISPSDKQEARERCHMFSLSDRNRVFNFFSSSMWVDTSHTRHLTPKPEGQTPSLSPHQTWRAQPPRSQGSATSCR